MSLAPVSPEESAMILVTFCISFPLSTHWNMSASTDIQWNVELSLSAGQKSQLTDARKHMISVNQAPLPKLKILSQHGPCYTFKLWSWIKQLCRNWLLEKCQVQFCVGWTNWSQRQPGRHGKWVISQDREWGLKCRFEGCSVSWEFRSSWSIIDYPWTQSQERGFYALNNDCLLLGAFRWNVNVFIWKFYYLFQHNLSLSPSPHCSLPLSLSLLPSPIYILYLSWSLPHEWWYGFSAGLRQYLISLHGDLMASFIILKLPNSLPSPHFQIRICLLL